ncbi:MAG TPA: membrane protein insertase YidC [Allosphingosinicella sp.]
MNEQRNMILAIALSAIVLFGWGIVTEYFFPTANPPATRIVDGKEVPVARPSDVKSTAPAPAAPAAPRDLATVRGESPRVAIETPRLRGSINLRGARIDDLVLSTEKVTIKPNSPPVRLFAPQGTADSYYAGFGWTGQGVELPGPDTGWTAPQGAKLTPETPVTLTWPNRTGQIFEIRLAVDKDYLFTAEQRVTNRGTGAVAVRPYSLISRAKASKDPDTWTLHVGPVGVFNGVANYDWGFEDLVEEGERDFASTGGWIGFGDAYWLAAVVPDQRSRVDAAFIPPTETGGFRAIAYVDNAVVAPNTATAARSSLFAGAKEIKLLDRYTASLGTPLEQAIDWGWFEWFMKPIFKLLNWLFAQLGNFGLAIIGLTLIVRLLMFPVAQKQFKSFAGMRVLQPKMKALQERYKDDKPRLQQEMLKLYQEEKVNPMAGCLPILIQIPIFYALYKVLLLAVEMRHQPFILWIKDLSAPDPLTPVNLFGYLPWDPPGFLALGVLPILLGVTMWLQFKLNPPPADPVQQQVFAFMPWVLMFVMAPFAAGLQLYWTVNNILTILQQKWLYSRHPGMKEAVATAPAKP